MYAPYTAKVAGNLAYYATYSKILYSYYLTVTNMKRNPNKEGNDDSYKHENTTAKSYAFLLPELRKEGTYEFIGWSEGSSTNVTVTGETYTMYASGSGTKFYATLTAQWVDTESTFKLVFQYPNCSDLLNGPSYRESGANLVDTSYKFTIPNVAPTRGGNWIFLGWTERLTPYADGVELYRPGSDIIVSRGPEEETVIKPLYAQWYRYKYEMKYDMNGALESYPPLEEYSALHGNRSVVISRQVPTSNTQIFSHWEWTPPGIDTTQEDPLRYDPGDSITLMPSKMTANISGARNGGNLLEGIFYESLDGWALNGGNGILPPNAVTLVATWDQTIATLSYSLRGGTGEFPSQTIVKTSGSQSVATFKINGSAPVRPSYTFYGWSTSATDREGAIYKPNGTIEVAFGQPVTLYAHWSYSPADTYPDVQYDEVSGRAISATGQIPLYKVTSKGQAAEKVIPPYKEGEGYDINVNPTYRTELYKRVYGEHALTYLGQPVWYYTKKVYEDTRVSLILVVTNSAEPNLFNESSTLIDEYMLRVVTISSTGEEYNAFYSFYIEPATMSDDELMLQPPTCYLTKVVEDGDSNFVERRMDIEGITKFSRTFDTSILEYPVMTRPVRDRFLMDMGNTETYSLSFTRVNPRVTNDLSTESKDWSNGYWISRFRDFMDFWQNLSYEPVKNVQNEYQRSGGFRFVYSPPDVTLFPVIDKNVFVKGAVDFDYTVGRVKGNLTLVVANMNTKSSSAKPKLLSLYFTDSKASAEAGMAVFSADLFQGLPFMVPQFPSSFGDDCAYWTSTSGTILYPGESKEGIVQSEYFYPVRLELGDIAQFTVPSTDTLTIPEYATIAKLTVVGGGGAGGIGNFLFRLGLGDSDSGWQDDNLCDYNCGAGGGSGHVAYRAISVIGNETMHITVGKGAVYGKDKVGGTSSIIYRGSVTSAKGGDSANGTSPGTSQYSGGPSFSKGGWFDLGRFSYSDNTGTTNASSPRGIPGKGNKLGSGGGAAALEAGINGVKDDVTSRGGYWENDRRYDAKYGGGGAGGGFKGTMSHANTEFGRPGDGATGYVQVAFYKVKS
jgi:uncharacterized repeat protein (TIGR02543 family)